MNSYYINYKMFYNIHLCFCHITKINTTKNQKQIYTNFNKKKLKLTFFSLEISESNSRLFISSVSPGKQIITKPVTWNLILQNEMKIAKLLKY